MRKVYAKIRRKLKLFTVDEVISVVQTVGHCSDRADFEWKLKCRLDELKK